MMKEMKRLLSFFLCFVMLVGILPVGALATEQEAPQIVAEAPVQEEVVDDVVDEGEGADEGEIVNEGETADEGEELIESPTAAISEEEIAPQADNIAKGTVVIAGGDFQEAGDHTASAQNVRDILDTIYEVGYTAADGFLFIGDYDCETHDDTNETNSGINALMSAVQETYSNLNHSNSILVQGNHDVMVSNIDATGGHDFDAYSTFVLNEDDYPNYGGSESQAKTLAEKLDAYLTAKLEAGYAKPIFVVSHLPLAFGPRTNTQGDAKYAKYLFDVLNEAAGHGLNIFFLHGHDHAYGYDNYLGGEAIFLRKGDSINIAEVGSQSKYTTETLNFTYMNAGYVGYYNESGYTTSNAGTDMLTMTVFDITDSAVTVSRYSHKGAYNLKSAGRLTGNYIGNVNVTANTAVYETSQTIALTPVKVRVTDPETTASVYGYGVSNLVVTPQTNVAGLEEYASYQAYDLTFNHSGEVEITLPVPAGYANVKVLYVPENGEPVDMNAVIADGVATFITDHNSVYAVVGSEETGEWTDLKNGGKTYTLDTNGVTANKDYLIVNSSSNGTRYALTNNNGSAGRTEVTVSDGTITVDDDTNIVWQFSGSTSGTVKNGDHYVYLGNNSAVLSEDSRNLTISHQSNGAYRIYRDGSTDYYLRYSSNSWGRSSSSSSSSNVYLYELTSSGTGTFGLLEGTRRYTADLNTSEDDVIAIILQNITVSEADDSSGTGRTNVTDTDRVEITGSNYDGDEEGTYTFSVTLDGVNLGNVYVTVADRTPISATPTANIGYVTQYDDADTVVRNADGSAVKVTVTYSNGSTETKDLTVGMVLNANTEVAGTKPGMKLSINGYTPDETFTLVVSEKYINDDPEYPDEGAVKVSKTAEGVDFQSSGIAKVELSTSGVPLEKGIDVIIMVDTSSSMNTCMEHGERIGDNHNCGLETRADAFEEALEDLTAQLKRNGEDGEPMDIQVALADFNGFEKSDSRKPYYWDSEDILVDDIQYSAAFAAKVYTNINNAPGVLNTEVTNGIMSADAFVPAANLPETYNFTYHSGTNYDYAFDAVYQLAIAAKAKNEAAGEERDLYVVFMSDGAPMQYNYFHSNGDSELLQYYLQGQITQNSVLRYYHDSQDDSGTMRTAIGYGAFQDGANTAYYNTEGKHWMAEAIKGDPSTYYPVIRKGIDGADEEGFLHIPGLGAKMFSIAFCPAVDQDTPVAAMTHVLENIASPQTGSVQYYYNVDDADELSSAFTSIGSAIAYAATNARFVDQMGAAFDLQLSTRTYEVVDGNSVTQKTLTPTIEVKSYEIYTRADFEAGNCEENEIGVRKGASSILETVTFDTTGTAAYSDKKSGNILVNGVIEANTFWYNNSTANVMIDTNGDGVTDYPLEPETFYWKIGTVQTTEFALSYYVYLTGSMEGVREAGSYATNTFATLYYDNYRGVAMEKPTVSPTVAWKSANVSYAFYLVDSNGNVIVNQTTGQTGTFANKIAITSPVVYDEILLNNQDQIRAISVTDVAGSILPEGYTLYDESAAYYISIRSNGTGYWEIEKDSALVDSTYVTQYKQGNTSAYSNALKNEAVGDDYTHTIVWFAVVWQPKTIDDTVVVDFGLPVDIDVLYNDMFGDLGTLEYIANDDEIPGTEGVYGEATPDFTAITATGDHGTAAIRGTTAVIAEGDEVEKNVIRYTLADMMMDSSDVFYYAARYNGATNYGYHYGKLTIIPATTIYYEDTFDSSVITFKAFVDDLDGDFTDDVEKTTDGWTLAGATIDGVQDEDRPGEFSLPQIDADNVYGYDSAYVNMNTYSMGSAHKVTVDADSYATAEFSFKGTGFDVISMTSNETGMLRVQVFNANGGTEKDLFVDTFYGYSYVDGEWVVSTEQSNALYQIPVIKVEDLPYGQYSVKITATYNSFVDNTQKNDSAYELYLDAIRIYDPANDGATDDAVLNAYKEDGEGWPSYTELRNNIIKANDFDAATTGQQVSGAIFIDSQNGTYTMADYKSYGPNNELYLARGQSIAFQLDLGSNADKIAKVQIGVKSANAGKSVDAQIYNLSADGNQFNEVNRTFNTSTDLYQEITTYRNNIIVITNNSTDADAILSLTNIKVTYTENPNAAAPANFLFMTPAAATMTLRTMNLVEEETPVTPEPEVPEVPEEPEVPETTEPEVPETTEPEVPETTEPEATEPEVPETSESETSKPDKGASTAVTIVKNIIKSVVNAISSLFGRWFR